MVYDEYISLKEKYKNSIVLIKVGNFYRTYDEDGVILHYLFQYKLLDNQVGFPVGTLKKVLTKLENKKISYYVNEEICNSYENNTYIEVLEKAEFYLELKKDVDDIYQYLTSNIERKYIKKVIHKIKEVIDEG